MPCSDTPQGPLLLAGHRGAVAGVAGVSLNPAWILHGQQD